MTEHFGFYGQDSPPAVEFMRVNREQAEHLQKAMQIPENQANFEVTLLPLDTPDQRWAAAVEWSAALQAKGDHDALARGAPVIFCSRDKTPEVIIKTFEDESRDEKNGGGVFVTHALMRFVRLKDGVSTYELFRDYYET